MVHGACVWVLPPQDLWHLGNKKTCFLGQCFLCRSLSYVYHSLSPDLVDYQGTHHGDHWFKIIRSRKKERNISSPSPTKIPGEISKLPDKCKTPSQVNCQAKSLFLRSKGLPVLSRTRATTPLLGQVPTSAPPGQLGCPGTRGRCPCTGP